jgi:acyl-CoA synthetase (NDP forming)
VGRDLSEQAVIRVESMEELLDVVLFLDSIDLGKLPAGPNVAPITFGGGFGVLAADQCARRGLATPPLADAAREQLKGLLPAIAAIGNPFDLTPVTYNQPAWMAKLPQALKVIAADDAIDTILFMCGPMGRHGKELAGIIRDLRDATRKTVCLGWPLAPAGMVERARKDGFFVFTEFDRAINAIAKVAGFAATSIVRSAARRPAHRPPSAGARMSGRRRPVRWFRSMRVIGFLPPPACRSQRAGLREARARRCSRPATSAFHWP